MNVLINPYTGVDSRIDKMYENFQIQNPNQSILETEYATSVCKLAAVKLLPLCFIEEEISSTSKSSEIENLKPTVYLITINKEDFSTLITASKNWNKLTQNIFLKIILIDN